MIAKKSSVINQEVLILFLFLLSLLNAPTLFFITIIGFLLAIHYSKKDGLIIYLMFIQLRSLINPGIAVSYGSTTLQLLKWIVIFSTSILILIKNKKCASEVGKIIFSLIFFSVNIILYAFLKSSFPVVASFKVISYVIPFVAIIKGINQSNDSEKLFKNIVKLLGIMIFAGIICIKSSIGYYVNGYAFQGIFNHPNLFGVMISIFIASFLYSNKKLDCKALMIIITSIWLIMMSKSRTSLISSSLTFIIFIISQNIKFSKKFLSIFAILLLLLSYCAINNSIIDTLNDFLYKGHDNSILYSRKSQFEANINRFKSSPLIGTGFNVPYNRNNISYSLSMDLVVENGNIILSLLGDIGLIGLLLFVLVYTKIFLIGKKNIKTIFFIPFLVSMGEMSFFSTNNFAIILYILFGMYIADGIKNKTNKLNL